MSPRLSRAAKTRRGYRAYLELLDAADWLKGEKRQGHRVHVVGLTKEGKKFVGMVLPSHSKFVKALMCALDGREQESLFRLCRKLRTGNPVGFFAEITHEDDDLRARIEGEGWMFGVES